MENNFTDEIGSTLLRLHRLIYSRNYIIQPTNIKWSPYYTSVITEIIIHLDFILVELKNPDSLNHPISFKDDIPPFHHKRNDHCYDDITSLVRFYRNAACHITAVSRMISFDGKQKIRFLYQYGTNPQKPTGVPHLCKYEDDIAILMGHHVLYVKRHLIRAFDEAVKYIFSLPRFSIYKKLYEYKSQRFS